VTDSFHLSRIHHFCKPSLTN